MTVIELGAFFNQQEDTTMDSSEVAFWKEQVVFWKEHAATWKELAVAHLEEAEAEQEGSLSEKTLKAKAAVCLARSLAFEARSAMEAARLEAGWWSSPIYAAADAELKAREAKVLEVEAELDKCEWQEENWWRGDTTPEPEVQMPAEGTIEYLNYQMDLAVKEERYEDAARLRDQIKNFAQKE